MLNPLPCFPRPLTPRMFLLFSVASSFPAHHLLNSEIAELMAVKSKFGAGGEFNPDWMPKVRFLYPASTPSAARSHPVERFSMKISLPRCPPLRQKPPWRTSGLPARRGARCTDAKSVVRRPRPRRCPPLPPLPRSLLHLRPRICPHGPSGSVRSPSCSPISLATLTPPQPILYCRPCRSWAPLLHLSPLISRCRAPVCSVRLLVPCSPQSCTHHLALCARCRSSDAPGQVSDRTPDRSLTVPSEAVLVHAKNTPAPADVHAPLYRACFILTLSPFSLCLYRTWLPLSHRYFYLDLVT